MSDGGDRRLGGMMHQRQQLSAVMEKMNNSGFDDSYRMDESVREQERQSVNDIIRNNNGIAAGIRPSTGGKEETHDSITAKESRGVNALKTVMYLTLLFSAATVATASLWFVEDEKLRFLEVEMEAIAGEGVSGVQAYLNVISHQLNQVSMSYTSEYQSLFSSEDASPSWVNLTLPHFDQRIKNDATSELMFYAPIIPASSDVFLNEWKTYSIQNQGWIDEALTERGWDAVTTQIPDQVYSYSDIDGTTVPRFDNLLSRKVAPIWQVSPVPRNRAIINLDVLTIPVLSNGHLGESSSSTETDPSKGRMSATSDNSFLKTFIENDETEDSMAPSSFLSVPVSQTFDDTTSTSPFGYMFGLVSWHEAVSQAFQDSQFDISVNLQEMCGSNQSMTFLVQNGGKTQYQLPTDPPLELVDGPKMTQQFDFLYEGCDYQMTMHPIAGAENDITREIPILGFLIAAFLLVFLVAVFFWYNRLVKERQLKLLFTAKRSNAVVSSLFPEAVTNRLMQEAGEPQNRNQMIKRSGSRENVFEDESKNKLSSERKGKAIADFFPETTIMFADIVGFTAWSSMREPTQVFELLESIYGAFDEVARKRRVFKVETIGDCYVAVVGLPDPCDEHAIVMARFANDCRVKMNDIVRQLEITLGPDTADLCMRIGIHSGPVTAGVLRGDKARFQLFGDTMNTTSRIETTGKANRVHVSEQTAAYLMDAGKKHWLSLREDKVTAKGKGELTTYWLRIARAKRGKRNELASQSSTKSLGDESADTQQPLSPKPAAQGELSNKEMRLVDWITNELVDLLARISLKRGTLHTYPDPPESVEQLEEQSVRNLIAKMPLDEVVDTIAFPDFDADLADFMMMSKRGGGAILDEAVKLELRDFVKAIASMYADNMFHNFEHASHVTMSVVKLLSRIVAPGAEDDVNENAMKLHQSSYGIASDPLTQFTIALSALIHDVQHPGVPNSQLLKDDITLSGRYKKKSMAEQRSLDKSWKLLMDKKYSKLRRAIYQTTSEYQRFRQVLVNAVMATDLFDKAIGEKRKERWETAFNAELKTDPASLANQRATVVIEHIIQASDIAHIMQHWHVYRKWNGRLFEEVYKAYQNKRANSNPAHSWYEGEIAFFDNYAIPLATKLKECGVFGVSSDELLNYAQQNRQEWSLDGKKAVTSMLKAMKLETDGPIRGVSRYRSNDSLASMNLLSPPANGSKRGSAGTMTRASRGPRAPPTPGFESRRGSAGTSTRDASRSPTPGTRGRPRGASLGSSRDLSVSLHSQHSKLNMLVDSNSNFKLNLDDDDDGFEYESDLTEDSYARKGKDLNLPPDLTVLIVDDDNLNRRLFIRAVMALAPTWIVTEAESIDEALGIVDKSVDSFDVIFMDLHDGSDIGDLSGSEAVKLLREKGSTSMICGMTGTETEAIKGDTFDNTKLPFEPNVLLKELNKIMLQSGEFSDF